MDTMLGLKITRPLSLILQLVIAIIALTGGHAWSQPAPANEAKRETALQVLQNSGIEHIPC
jgi:hypothetical protein